MSAVLWWIRRDLRLDDNQALSAALSRGEPVIPVFILDPKLLASPYASQQRLGFLLAGLQVLDASLRRRGSGLVVRQGDPLEALASLRAQTRADAVFAEADVSPYARRRDERVRSQLPLILTPGVTVHPPETLRKADGAPYTVYRPFSRRWRELPVPGGPLPAPESLPALPPGLLAQNPAWPALPAGAASAALFPAGEAEARQRLAAFSGEGIRRYAGQRDRLDLDGTSALSPYLRFGMLSARRAVSAARQAVLAARQGEAQAEGAASRQGAEAWLSELIWREFFCAILYHFPGVRRSAFRSALHHVPWREDPDDFTAWTEGRTGYPVVDAAMRQLNATGWMHNRARMITASFLTKDLLIDWRWGERYFMQRLLDGDPAANNGGWQWIAGTGTDAAPYFRVFNPVLQGQKFDPQGAFVRRWLPELAAVPLEFIHEPWVMPLDLQRRVGCLVGKDYPAPLVDHPAARQRALAAYPHGDKK